MATDRELLNSISLTEYPIDIISLVAAYLDLCTLWNLADTCRFFRYHLLAIRHIWQKIVIDLKYCNHSQLYAGLRRFRDSNGLRSLVQEVTMDGNDDANISYIIMLVKFPQLRHLSARYRRFSTNVEADTKVLQELLKTGTLKPHSLPLEQVDIYHYYFTTEPHLEAFQKTLNRISKVPVQLDVRRCFMVNEKLQQQKEHQLITSSTVPIEQAMDEMALSNECYSIIAKEAQCWACLSRFERCWKCKPICAGCQRKRLPPLANDQRLQDLQRHRHLNSFEKKEALSKLHTDKHYIPVIDDPSLEDEFSVFG